MYPLDGEHEKVQRIATSPTRNDLKILLEAALSGGPLPTT
jgi:hypothetical protein